MIFSEERYFQANEIQNYNSFVWQSNDTDASIKIPFAIMGQEAISIPKAPYGGFVMQHLPNQTDTKSFLSSLSQYLTEKNVVSLQIKQNPDFFHTPSQNKLINSLFTQGFRKNTEINHHIDLSNIQEEDIHPMQRRRIKKCQNAGFTYQKESHTASAEIYDFLSQCRLQQGLSVNVSKSHFVRLLSQLADVYNMYTVRDSTHRLLACTVTITVTPEVTYNYLPAFDRYFATYSPLAFLTDLLIRDLKKANARFFDLGISSIDGTPQDSLIQFKERMGGIRSERDTYIIHV
ncbi:GNAT family N-acetyltransferase [Reichenbachiella agarivorans]|uniref:GNAT family N-acetyltransferase n=1 Tax=Reichenbachiella agarivorans TaxID=2979464 RepID=A0ABY6CR30_9BACT|nr:GNAT family N-acetyltransferase [Reichenbachiella agarivorans]UXP32956.1 GNAT family N-acetyltransferase [Reichenbachiella agarivorans]